MNPTEIKSLILELCSEDAYGSWELWWKVSADISSVPPNTLREQFIDAVEELINEQKVVASNHKGNGAYEEKVFDRPRLTFEIENADKPVPDSFYWFSLKQ